MELTWSLMADMDGDETYETDLTGYVEKPGSGITIQRGIGRDGKPLSSRMNVALSNRGGEFTPGNTASPFYGQMRTGTPVRLTVTHASGSYTRWTGYILSWRTSWAVGQVSMAPVVCGDLFELLRDAETVNVTASTSRDTDGALVEILTAMGLDSGDYDLDDGVQDLPMHFCVGEEPLAAMMAVAASEMGGMLYPDVLGRVRFEARNSRLGTNPVAIWGDGTEVVPVSVEYDLNPNEFCTSVTARGTVFHEGQADTLLWEDTRNMLTNPASSLEIAPGEVYERVYQTASAYVALTALEQTKDFLANSAADGSGTDETASLSLTLTELGGGYIRLRRENTSGSTIYNTRMRVRGQPVEFYADRPAAMFSLAVTGRPVGKSLQFDVPFAGDEKLRDYAYQELMVGRYPWPVLRLTFMASSAAEIAALLAADLGQLIYYADNDLPAEQRAYVDDWWYIEAISDAIPPDWAGQAFRTTVTLVPSYVYRDLDAIVFDTFDRDDASGDLGTSFSGDVWADDTGFDISGGYAVPNDAGLQVPSMAVA